jgi:hypothetical protein
MPHARPSVSLRDRSSTLVAASSGRAESAHVVAAPTTGDLGNSRPGLAPRLRCARITLDLAGYRRENLGGGARAVGVPVGEG